MGVNSDFRRLRIPRTKDNSGIDYILNKHYTSTGTKTWISQELDVYNQSRNIDIVSSIGKRESGIWFLTTDSIGRGLASDLESARRKIPLRDRKSRYTDTIGRLVSEIRAILTLKGRMRILKYGGARPSGPESRIKRKAGGGGSEQWESLWKRTRSYIMS